MVSIFTEVVSPFSQNARVVACPATREAVIVDPGACGADLERIEAILDKNGLTLTGIWLTHSHLDHCGGVAELLARRPVPLFGHSLERYMRENVEQIARMYGLPPSIFRNCPEPSHYIGDGDTLRVGKAEFTALFTPGHSPGHLSFYSSASAQLIAGDALFAGSIGRTDLPGGDYELLIRSIREKLLTLPDETTVLSGHGPDTAIGREKRSNPFLLEGR